MECCCALNHYIGASPGGPHPGGDTQTQAETRGYKGSTSCASPEGCRCPLCRGTAAGWDRGRWGCWGTTAPAGWRRTASRSRSAPVGQKMAGQAGRQGRVSGWQAGREARTKGPCSSLAVWRTHCDVSGAGVQGAVQAQQRMQASCQPDGGLQPLTSCQLPAGGEGGLSPGGWVGCCRSPEP
jgi:hypothetical protein